MRSPAARRRLTGILLAIGFLLSGRLIRHRLLIAPDGAWREHMWLDEILPAASEATAAEKAARPVLTTPLPINTCSTDSLTLLPGVGPVLAGRIGELRAEGLIFRVEEDLRKVKGIGQKLSARLAPLVDFGQIAPADSLSEDSPQN